ncbi:MAG: CAP domain-containing protein [Firmicutes bacterium]|nr:CAP domain-containing protein [Bacillota bacterium]
MKKKFLMAALVLCIAAGSADIGFGFTAEKGISFGGIFKLFSLNWGQGIGVPSKPSDSSGTAGSTGSSDSSGTAGSTGTTDSTGSTGTVSTVNSMEKQVASLTNSERKAKGLSALTLDSQLSKLARIKAEDMAKKGYFSHTSPTYGSAFDMMNKYGVSYRTAGENIAKGQKTAESVMNGWMNSSGHRANILSSAYTNIGVGYAKDSRGNTYWVQIFKG